MGVVASNLAKKEDGMTFIKEVFFKRVENATKSRLSFSKVSTKLAVTDE
jgi:hypothetical protein